MKTALIIQKSKTVYKLYGLNGDAPVPIGDEGLGTDYPELAPWHTKRWTNEYRGRSMRLPQYANGPTRLMDELVKLGFSVIFYVSLENNGEPDIVTAGRIGKEN